MEKGCPEYVIKLQWTVVHDDNFDHDERLDSGEGQVTDIVESRHNGRLS